MWGFFQDPNSFTWFGLGLIYLVCALFGLLLGNIEGWKKDTLLLGTLLGPLVMVWAFLWLFLQGAKAMKELGQEAWRDFRNRFPAG